jgi:hypothetical protein
LDYTTPLFNKSHANTPVLVHDIFMGVHVLFINHTVLIATILSLPFQLWTLVACPFLGLSVAGLALQAIVFSLLAVSWDGRIVEPQSWTENPDPEDSTFLDWYKAVGWFCTDSLVFAGMQRVSFVAAVGRRMILMAGKGVDLDAGVQLEGGERDEEIQPLLGLDERESAVYR